MKFLFIDLVFLYGCSFSLWMQFLFINAEMAVYCLLTNYNRQLDFSIKDLPRNTHRSLKSYGATFTLSLKVITKKLQFCAVGTIFYY
ncbi:hypothetical protein EB796_018362 [Bugula neritina]|uniref:Uncharacterized protein n=1 Tax=Bugula neritina TaxID=10212 RepID=A0A7J7JB81_BUGNE|nr:hypothetical protein EB796_018362 [Bugula neritina]